ncbi:hypothetical protein GLW00_03350 [Halobacillus litoralis]|uniref:Uncharacterized protein n=1 Tax=Halobacillus litoralis TaxID=45668 RepID=A0A845F7K1_9BACI|nr:MULTISPECIES: hypothetical protein [Halobacillus]MBN9655040.1 hypothetical protein [Halobacillus sp. GSS1]MEC3884043.1 hypothetical protein [Halobacillus sp. HZG1]MYL69869.1 hypothetical protein [Halobacillus litoralis]
MGDLIPFRRTGNKKLDDAILKFQMHVEKMKKAKSKAEINYHYNEALHVLKEARNKREER